MSLFERAENAKSKEQMTVTDGYAVHPLKSLDESGYERNLDSKLRNDGPEAQETCAAAIPQPDYATLAAFTIDPISADLSLDAALFLFALNTIRTCPPPEFMEMGHRYCPHWRKRMDPEAWAIVKSEIAGRLRDLGYDPKTGTIKENP